MEDPLSTHKLNYDAQGHLRSLESTSGKGKKKTDFYTDPEGRLDHVRMDDGTHVKLRYDGDHLAEMKNSGVVHIFEKGKDGYQARKEVAKKGKDGKYHSDWVKEILIPAGKEEYGVILRDKLGRPRILVRKDGKYRILLSRPGEKYTPPKGLPSQLADWLDKKIGVAGKWWGRKTDGKTGIQYIPGLVEWGLEGTVDSLRMGEGSFQGYRAFSEGNYGAGLLGFGTDILRGLALWGGAGGAIKKGAQGVGLAVKVVKNRKLQKSLLDFEKEFLKKKGATTTLSKESAQSLKKKAERLSSINKSKGKLKGSGIKGGEKSVGEMAEEGMIHRITKMDGGGVGKGARELYEVRDIYRLQKIEIPPGSKEYGKTVTGRGMVESEEKRGGKRGTCSNAILWVP